MLDATSKCVMRLGFDATTIDDISRESGISRASIYRWFGGKDVLLRALLERMAEPYLQRCAAISIGSGNLAERIEEIIVVSIESLAGFPWLTTLVRDGMSRATMQIFRTTHRSVAGGVIAPMLQAAMASGTWRAPDDIDTLMQWLLRQILAWGSDINGDIEEIRNAVAIYIMPVLQLHPEPSGETTNIAERLQAIEALLSKMSSAK